MYEIIGYLLYCLIDKGIYNINNLDFFLSKDEFTLINLAKILKYAFFYSNKISAKISNEFKETKLFKKKYNIFAAVYL